MSSLDACLIFKNCIFGFFAFRSLFMIDVVDVPKRNIPMQFH